MSRNYTQYPVVLFNRSVTGELQTEEVSIAKFRVTALLEIVSKSDIYIL